MIKRIATFCLVAVVLTAAAFAQSAVGIVLPITAPVGNTPATINPYCGAGLNTVCFRPVTLFAQQTFTYAQVNVVTAAPVSGHTYIGIYSADGSTLLTQVVFNTHFLGNQSVTWNPQVTLPAGNYTYAIGADGTNTGLKGAYIDLDAACGVYYTGACGNANNLISGGAMPASLGGARGGAPVPLAEVAVAP